MADPTTTDTGFTVFHALWTGAITVGGAIVAFFTKRLVDQVDAKADKCDVDDLKDAMKILFARQDDQHRQNTERLDTIILELGRRPNSQR